VLNEAAVRQAEETKTAVFGKWFDADLPGLARTEMTVAATALEWTPEDVAAGVADFLTYLG
jgi:phage terminase large subunit-like protein